MAAVSAKPRRVGKSGFLIQDGLTVYVDPVDVPAGLPKADIVFLTGPGEGRYSPKDVEAVSTASTVVAGSKDCVARFRLNQLPVREGEVKNVLGLSVRIQAAGEPGCLSYVLHLPGGALLAAPGREPEAAA